MYRKAFTLIELLVVIAIRGADCDQTFPFQAGHDCDVRSHPLGTWNFK